MLETSSECDFEKADWKSLIKNIAAEQDNEEFSWSLIKLSAESLESEAEKLQTLIIKWVEKYVSKKKQSERFKSWWSDELKQLRKEITKYRRKWRRYSDTQAE